jgi:hypothetical protein
MRPHVNHFSRPPRPPAVGDIARQLRELPSEAAPPYDFAEFRRRSEALSAPRRQWVTWPHAAAAAGLTAVVAAMALLGTSGGPGANDDVGPAVSGRSTVAVAPANASIDSPDGEAPASPRSAGAADGSSTSPRSAGAADGGSASPRGLASNSGAAPVVASAATSIDPFEQALAAREWLARQPAEPALVRAGSRLAVTGLEDRIAWFDDALTDQRLHGANPAQLKVLQQERARLVSSLAQVRYAEALVANGS